MRQPAGKLISGSNGITYELESSTPWGKRGSPIVPRVYRHLFPDEKPPKSLRDILRNKHLNWADLGRDVWIGRRLASLPKSVRQEVAKQLVQVPVPYTAVAIPAGLPLGRVVKLALRVRTRNGVKRLVEQVGEGILDRSLLVEDLIEIPNVGIGTVLDLLCVMESAELNSADLQIKGESGVKRQPEENEPVALQHLRNLAVWALSETGAVTLGDAIRHLTSRPASVEEWRRLNSIELRALAEPCPHPYHNIDRWVANLPERERVLLETRIACRGNPTPLAELAADFGYTRERVRQLEKLLLNQFRHYIRTGDGKPIGWRIDSMRIRFGVAIPEADAQEFLDPPKGSSDYSDLLLRVGGPYIAKMGWWVLKDAIRDDPTQSILERHVDRYGRVSLEQAKQILTGWGLRTAYHERWLSRGGKCRWFEDDLVRWNVPIADKLHFALGRLSKPSTAEDLLAVIEEQRSVKGARNVMSTDDRFKRTSQRLWALSEWGLPEYRGIALSIRKMLEESGGALPIAEVVQRMHSVFRTPENSASAYCHAPLFVIEGEKVRIRRQEEEYIFPVVPKTGVPGMFLLGQDRISILLKVDRNVLRGSGKAIGAGSPTLLRIDPGSARTFTGQDGLSLRVTFSETSLTGPTLGSMRKIAERLRADQGDWLTLRLDLGQGHLESTVTRVNNQQPTWALVGQLTGLADGASLHGLGKALGCSPQEVREVLASRGDDVVILAMPLPE